MSCELTFNLSDTAMVQLSSWATPAGARCSTRVKSLAEKAHSVPRRASSPLGKGADGNERSEKRDGPPPDLPVLRSLLWSGTDSGRGQGAEGSRSSGGCLQRRLSMPQGC